MCVCVGICVNVCVMRHSNTRVLFRTWYGPIWTPAQTLQGVLLSIQSIMSEKPYHNEPGYEQVLYIQLYSLHIHVFLFKSQERSPGDVQAYNNIIIHETLRVAVCNNLDGQHKFPPKLL